MKRSTTWRGTALREEVARLRGLKLEYQAIAQIMGIAERTVQNICNELGLGKLNPKPKTDTQIRSLLERVTKVKPVGEMERHQGELPLDYATRVLKAVDELPMVSKTPLEKITAANRVLKGRGLKQIVDRPGWAV